MQPLKTPKTVDPDVIPFSKDDYARSIKNELKIDAILRTGYWMAAAAGTILLSVVVDILIHYFG